MMNDEEEGYFISSDNPFADAGLPDAEESLVRTELLCYIVIEIKRRGLSRRQAASLLGVSQSQIRLLLDARMSKFSLESLLVMMLKLGAGVTTFCEPTTSEPGHITISVPQSA
ncbi:MAG TPA: XRE family transcriptional regulator [Ktedonobacteraceae bacterium]|nr:XRE family transcriptional regulator [Ktedonobacteraceae bacterium]